MCVCAKGRSLSFSVLKQIMPYIIAGCAITKISESCCSFYCCCLLYLDFAFTASCCPLSPVSSSSCHPAVLLYVRFGYHLHIGKLITKNERPAALKQSNSPVPEAVPHLPACFPVPPLLAMFMCIVYVYKHCLFMPKSHTLLSVRTRRERNNSSNTSAHLSILFDVLARA